MRADILARLQALLSEGRGQRPPLAQWDPPFSGDIDIRIAGDGRWYHEGTPFEREALVRLFASILRREGDGYFLVTPVEKWRLRVDNTPFVAIDCDVLGEAREQHLVFVTNTGERVHCNARHPLYLRRAGEAWQPCIAVRDGLEARVDRGVFYRLVESGAIGAEGEVTGAWSGGEFFPLDMD